MESGLQKRIKNYLETMNLTVTAFERKSGLKTNVVRNILRGQSKKPTGETLQAIANVMECTIQDLLEGKSALHREEMGVSPHESPAVQFPEILNEILGCVQIMSKKNKYKLSVHQTLRLVEEIYSYTIKKNPPKVDTDFVEWFVERTVR
jgi:transcriptional regulator with XRE-family HTH domain